LPEEVKRRGRIVSLHQTSSPTIPTATSLALDTLAKAGFVQTARISALNIERYRRVLTQAPDPAQPIVIETLVQDEEAKVAGEDSQ